MAIKIVSGKLDAPRRTLVYGPPGIGKSTFAAGNPRNLFLQTEAGTNDLDVPRIISASGTVVHSHWGHLVQSIGEVTREKDSSYTGLVIDGIQGVWQLAEAYICSAHRVASLAEINYGKGVDKTVSLIVQLLKILEATKEACGYDIILLSHSKSIEVRPPDSDQFTQIVPDVVEKLINKVTGWCDDVLYCTYETQVKKIDTGFGRTSGRATGAKRVAITRNARFCLAKCRAGIPDKIPLDWGCYRKKIDKSKETKNDMVQP